MAVLSTGLPLADRYLLIEQLGSGGMAVVWRGFDDLLGRPVAVKVLNAEIAADPAFRAAIYREARSSARLSHPHITHVYDYGEATLPDGETVSYVVMELLDGRTLDSRLGDGPLPWPEAVRVAAQVADALAAAHRRGIVHRDIAPANVMLTPTGAKVLDFGIAALAGGRGDADGDMMGTPAYVAPERLEDAPAAPAADVYALGATLYEALTGEPPLPARTWPALVEAYRHGARIPPLQVDGLPPEVADLCARCLSRDPARRPGSAEVARVLAGAVPPGTGPAPATPTARAEEIAVQLGARPTEQPVTGDGWRPSGSGPAGAVGRVTPVTVTAGEGEPVRGRRWPRLVLGLAALVLAVGLVLAAASALNESTSNRNQPTMAIESTAPSAAGVAPGAGTSPGTKAHGPAAANTPRAQASTPPGPATPSAVPATPLATLQKLYDQVTAGQQAGKIRPDVALDLQNTVRNLESRVSAGASVNYAGEANALRQKILNRAQEQGPPPALDSAYAQTLLATVDAFAKF